MEGATPLLLISAPAVGSFLGLLVKRLPSASPVLLGRSRCDSCGHVLAARDLVPLLSALYLRFHCRYCAERIDPAHWFAELGAFVIAIWALWTKAGLAAGLSCIFGWLLLAQAVVDWRHFILPNALTILIALAGLLMVLVTEPTSLLDHMAGAALGFGLLAGLAVLYKRIGGRDGMGFGDAKFGSAIGAWVGAGSVLAVLFVAALIGLAVAAVLSISGRDLDRSSRLPFGTFLAAAGWLIWLYGPVNPLLI